MPTPKYFAIFCNVDNFGSLLPCFQFVNNVCDMPVSFATRYVVTSFTSNKYKNFSYILYPLNYFAYTSLLCYTFTEILSNYTSEIWLVFIFTTYYWSIFRVYIMFQSVSTLFTSYYRSNHFLWKVTKNVRNFWTITTKIWCIYL